MNKKGTFFGYVKASCNGDDPTGVICDIDAMMDSLGLGEALGCIARNHLQAIPAAARGVELQKLLAAFVTNASDPGGLTILKGGAEMIAIPEDEGVKVQ